MFVLTGSNKYYFLIKKQHTERASEGERLQWTFPPFLLNMQLKSSTLEKQLPQAYNFMKKDPLAHVPYYEFC